MNNATSQVWNTEVFPKHIQILKILKWTTLPKVILNTNTAMTHMS